MYIYLHDIFALKLLQYFLLNMPRGKPEDLDIMAEAVSLVACRLHCLYNS